MDCIRHRLAVSIGGGFGIRRCPRVRSAMHIVSHFPQNHCYDTRLHGVTIVFFDIFDDLLISKTSLHVIVLLLFYLINQRPSTLIAITADKGRTCGWKREVPREHFEHHILFLFHLWQLFHPYNTQYNCPSYHPNYFLSRFRSMHLSFHYS